jgi:hypothetical protein
MTVQESHVSARRDERGRWLELPPAMAAKKWQKGMPSANPGGKTGEYQRAVKLARDKSVAAMERMVQLAELDSVDESGRLAPLSKDSDPRVAAMCAQWVYERAWGKVKDYDPTKDAGEPLANAQDRRGEAMTTLMAAFQRVLDVEQASQAQTAGVTEAESATSSDV